MIPHVIRPEIIDPDERAGRGVTGRDLNGGIVSPPATFPPFTKQDREAVLFNLRGEAPLPYPFALTIAERYEATVVALETERTNQPAHDPYVTHTMPKPDMPAAQGLLPPSPSLDRCPFCGERAVILDSHDGDPQVGCQTFACRGLWKEGPIFSSQYEAIVAWNQRPVNAEIKYLVGHAAEQATIINTQTREANDLLKDMLVQEAVVHERGETIDQLILEGKKLGDEVQRLRKLVAEKTLEVTALEVAQELRHCNICHNLMSVRPCMACGSRPTTDINGVDELCGRCDNKGYDPLCLNCARFGDEDTDEPPEDPPRNEAERSGEHRP